MSRFGLGKGSIGPEQQPDSFLLVSLHDWLQNLPPPLSAVDVARAKHCTFAISEMVEQEERVITYGLEVAVVDDSLLLPMHRAFRAVHV